ncbi:hypothetical protein D3C71_1476480 [compost metagenome]
MHHFNQLGRVRVQIDHVARLFGGLSARVHRHRHIGLRQRGRVVGAVTGHRYQTAFRLILANQRQLGFRRRFRQEVVYPGFGGDRGGGQWVITGDHHRFDTHFTQLGETLFNAALDDILQRYHAQYARAFRYHQRRTASARHAGDQLVHRLREVALIGLHVTTNGVHCPFADHAVLHVDAAHARLGGEGHESGVQRLQVTFAQVEALLRQHHDATAFRRFVRQG